MSGNYNALRSTSSRHDSPSGLRAPSVGSRDGGLGASGRGAGAQQMDAASSSLTNSTYGSEVMSRGWFNTALSVVQGAVYSVTRVHHKSWLLTVLLQLFEVTQVITFILTPDSAWYSLASLNTFLSWTNIGIQSLSFVLYYIALAVVTACLPFAVANVIFVGRAFQRSDFTKVWPLRTLRFFLGGLMDVLYIPMLSVLTAPLKCDNASGQQIWSLGTTYSQTCWTFPFVIPQAIALIDLVVVIPMSLTVILVSFDSNPLSGSLNAQVTGRAAIANLILRTVLVIVNRLTSDSLSRSITVLIICIILVGLQIYLVPYFNRGYNHFIATLYSVPLAMSIVYIAMAVGTPNVIHTVMVFVLPVIVAPLVCLGSVMRFRYLEKKATAMIMGDGRANEVGPLQHSTSSVVGSPYEAWLDQRQPKSGAAFPSAHFVEVYARFPLAAHLELPIQERLRRSAFIYEQGLRQFPTDAAVKMCYASFMLFYKNDPGLANHYIQESKKNSPVFDTLFQIYAREHDALRERRAKNLGEDALDVISYVELQKNMKHALRYHKEAVAKMRAFWGYLLQSNADVSALPAYMQAITAAEKKASDSYKHLVVKFSRSPTVLRHYADFCMNVTLDYDQAFHYYQLAETHAEEKGDAGNTIQLESLGGSSRARHRTYRQRVLNRKSSTNARFGRVMLGMLLFIGASMIVQFTLGAVGFNLQLQSLKNTDVAQERRRLTQELLVYSRLMEIGNNINSTLYYENGKQKLLESALELRLTNSELFDATIHNTAEIDASWESNNLPLVYIVQQNPELQVVVNSSVMDAINSMVQAAMNIAQLTQEECYGLRYTNDFRFISINANGVLTDYLDASLKLYLDYSLQINQMMVIIQSAIFGAMIFFLFVASGLVYRPAFLALERERSGIVSLFKNIPVAAVAQIFNGLQHDRDDDPDDAGAPAQDIKMTENKQNSTMRNSRVKYWSAVWFLIAMALLFLLLPLITAQQTTNFGPEVRYSGGLGYVATQIRYFSIEVIVADNYTYSEKFVHDRLNASIILFADIFQWVMYGNESLGLPGYSARYPPVRELMGSATCVAGNATLCAEHPQPDGVIGMEALQRDYLSLARIALYMRQNETLVYQWIYEKIHNINQFNLVPGIQDLVLLLEDEAGTALNGVVYTHAAFFGVTMLIMFCMQVFLFRPMVRLLNDESSKTAAMLLMIPPRIIDSTPLLKAFFESDDLTQVLATQADLEKTAGELGLTNINDPVEPLPLTKPSLRKEPSLTSLTPHSKRGAQPAVVGVVKSLLSASTEPMMAIDMKGNVVQINEASRVLLGLEFENQAIGQSIGAHLRFGELLVAAGNGASVRMQLTDRLEGVDVRTQTFQGNEMALLLITATRLEGDYTDSTGPPGTLPWAVSELNAESRPAVVTEGTDLKIVAFNTLFLEAVNEVENRVRGASITTWATTTDDVSSSESDGDMSDRRSALSALTRGDSRTTSPMVRAKIFESVLIGRVAPLISPARVNSRRQSTRFNVSLLDAPMTLEATRLRLFVPGHCLVTFTSIPTTGHTTAAPTPAGNRADTAFNG